VAAAPAAVPAAPASGRGFHRERFELIRVQVVIHVLQRRGHDGITHQFGRHGLPVVLEAEEDRLHALVMDGLLRLGAARLQ
jgi:hypothetical protein